MAKKIFISHATKDQDLVGTFVDLLQTGLDIRGDDILCVSTPGFGVPAGRNFVDYLQKELRDCKLFIAIISPMYYDSPFCLCELGAIWAVKMKDFFPILLPPLSYSDLKAVLAGIEVRKMDRIDHLNELKDRVTELGCKTNSARWEVQRTKFLNSLPGIFKALQKPDHVERAKHQELEQKYQDALNAIKEQDEEVTQLKQVIEALRTCKDADQVAEVLSEFTDEREQFDQLVSAAENALKRLDYIVRQALMQHRCRDHWYPSSEELEQADVAKGRQLLDSDYKPNSEHPKVRTAEDAIAALSRFLADSESLAYELEKENQFPTSLANSQFWEEYLGL